MSRTITRIPSEALQMEVQGVNLEPGRMADQLGDGVRTLVFLRHLG